ncbi:STAS domain-containing protein [Streptomyces sp. NPDC048514]|uniref:STAS domain-containing protein n=1 Tax=Streptomyces sp. NPDC048514 TaxID=3365564 RepID=UPI003714853E
MHFSAHGGRVGSAPCSPGGGSGSGGSRILSPSLATATYEASGSRVRVTVTGELDLDSQQSLRSGLFEALADSVTGLDLDLSRVDFCDCAGLSILLELRQRALNQSKTVVIQATSPAMDLLLTLLQARELFQPQSPRSIQMPRPAPAPGPARWQRQRHRAPCEPEGNPRD